MTLPACSRISFGPLPAKSYSTFARNLGVVATGAELTDVLVSPAKRLAFAAAAAVVVAEEPPREDAGVAEATAVGAKLDSAAATGCGAAATGSSITWI